MYRNFDHDLTFGAVEGVRSPIRGIQILDDRSAVAQQAAPHPALNGQALMESDTPDTGTGGRRYRRVPLNAVGALVFDVRKQRSYFTLLGFAVRIHNLDDEFEWVHIPDMREFIQPLPVVESRDNLKHFRFLFRC